MRIKIYYTSLIKLRISCKIQLIDQSASHREKVMAKKRTDQWRSEIDIDRRQASAGHRIIISFTKENDSVYTPAVQVSTTCYTLYPVRMVGGQFFFLFLSELGGRSSVCLSGERFSSGASFKSAAFYPSFSLSGQRTGCIVPRTKIASSKKYPRDVSLLPFLSSLSRPDRYALSRTASCTSVLWIREINSSFVQFASFKGHWRSLGIEIVFISSVWFILAL